MARSNKKAIHSKPATVQKTENKRFFLFYLLIILVLITALYSKTIKYELSYFDDDVIILANTKILNEGFDLKKAFLTDAEFSHKMELYRPMQNISIMGNYALFGNKFGLYRITNMIFHLLNCLILFLLANHFIKNKYLSATAGILFAIHPIFVLDVAWIPALGDIFLGFFGLLSLLFYVKFLKSKQKRFFVLHVVAVFMALLSKESAIVLPIVCVIIGYFYSRPDITLKKLIIYFLWMTPGIILFFILRKLAIHVTAEGSFGIIPFLNNLRIIPEFFFKFFIPYPIPTIPFYETSRTLVGVWVIAAFTGLLVYLKPSARIVIPGISMFLLLSIPAMLYRPDWSNYVYDYCFHRSYFPVTGILLTLFASLDNISTKRWFFIPVIAYLFILFLISNSFVPVFQNTLSFYLDAAKTNSGSVFVQNNLGNAYFMNGNLDLARKQYEKSIIIKPDFADAQYNLGVIYARDKNYKQALVQMDKAIKINHDNPKYHKTKAKILLDQKNFAQAAKVYKHLRDKGFSDEAIDFGYALCLFNLRNYKNAVTELKSVVDTYPNNQEAFLLLTNAYHYSGMINEALQEYKKMPGYNTNPDLICNSAYLFFDLDSIPQALDRFTNSLKMKPGNIDAFLGLALCYYASGNQTLAKEQLMAAANIDQRIKEGSPGLQKMMNEGYYFSQKELSLFDEMFSKLKF